MRPFIALVLIALSLGAFASELRIFELQHRTATELIPILQPMLEADAAISGTGDTLIVRSSRQNLGQIASLLERLDRAPQQLRIIVEQDGAQQHSRSGVGLSGSSREARVQARIDSRRRDVAQHSAQQLRVLEGQWAMIRTGRAVPQVVQHYSRSATGTRIERHTEYRDVDSGFEVRPRLSGERVTLDIRPFRANLSGNGVIDHQAISTTVSGRLGQWIELGSAAQSGQQTGQGIAYSSAEREHGTHNVRLKVERIHD